MKIIDVEGIGPSYAAKLADAGVRTTDEFLAGTATPAGRSALSASTGIPSTLLLEWANHVDLMRIKGVGSEYADLLEAAGVDSCPELARRNAANLLVTLGEVNEAKALVRRLPTADEVADWITQAGSLPKIITH